MNILVIGNGFDLAHGLPTTYGNFLEFMKLFGQYYEEVKRKERKYIFAPRENPPYKEYVVELFENENKSSIVNELYELSAENRLLKFFIGKYSNRKVCEKEGWIDFESEISIIVQAFEKTRDLILHAARNDQTRNSSQVIEIPNYLRECISIYIPKSFSFKNISDVNTIDGKKEDLLLDLNRITRCLEIYLTDFVETIEVKSTLPDIMEMTAVNAGEEFGVLSFNYTDTFERVYSKYFSERGRIIRYDYIHGKAELSHTVDNCNLVLGIDEYLDDDEKIKR